MRPISIAISSLLALLLTLPALAKESDYQQPVEVDSVRQLAELNANRVTFSEDVIITQGSIRIQADKVEVIRHGERGAEEMIAHGQPATFFQILDNGKPVHAQANELRYQLKQRLVTLSRNAEVKQEDSKVSGDLIRYDIEKQQIVAESAGGSSRVKTIFLPQQVGDAKQPVKDN